MDGEPVEFGTSGLLYRSNKLMYDRKTGTLWRQFVGEPVVGPLAGSGIRLKMLPLALTTWGDWVAEHPDTTVLSLDTGVYPTSSYLHEDNLRSIYSDYRRAADTMFPVPLRSNSLAVKEPVFGLAFDGSAKAFPASALAEHRVVNDTVGGESVVIVANGGSVDGATDPRVYARDGHTFSPAPDSPTVGATTLIDESGRLWLAREEALVQADDESQQLERLTGRNAYWFGWFSAYPDTALYGEGEKQK